MQKGQEQRGIYRRGLQMHAEQLRLSSDQFFRLLNKPEQIEVASLKRITPLCPKIVSEPSAPSLADDFRVSGPKGPEWFGASLKQEEECYETRLTI
jgi:hypothetical protein